VGLKISFCTNVSKKESINKYKRVHAGNERQCELLDAQNLVVQEAIKMTQCYLFFL